MGRYLMSASGQPRASRAESKAQQASELQAVEMARQGLIEELSASSNRTSAVPHSSQWRPREPARGAVLAPVIGWMGPHLQAASGPLRREIAILARSLVGSPVVVSENGAWLQRISRKLQLPSKQESHHVPGGNDSG